MPAVPRKCLKLLVIRSLANRRLQPLGHLSGVLESTGWENQRCIYDTFYCTILSNLLHGMVFGNRLLEGRHCNFDLFITHFDIPLTCTLSLLRRKIRCPVAAVHHFRQCRRGSVHAAVSFTDPPI